MINKTICQNGDTSNQDYDEAVLRYDQRWGSKRFLTYTMILTTMTLGRLLFLPTKPVYEPKHHDNQIIKKFNPKGYSDLELLSNISVGDIAVIPG